MPPHIRKGFRRHGRLEWVWLTRKGRGRLRKNQPRLPSGFMVKAKLEFLSFPHVGRKSLFVQDALIDRLIWNWNQDRILPLCTAVLREAWATLPESSSRPLPATLAQTRNLAHASLETAVLAWIRGLRRAWCAPWRRRCGAAASPSGSRSPGPRRSPGAEIRGLCCRALKIPTQN